MPNPCIQVELRFEPFIEGFDCFLSASVNLASSAALIQDESFRTPLTKALALASMDGFSYWRAVGARCGGILVGHSRRLGVFLWFVAASAALLSRIATVTGPTPPGTGVRTLAISLTSW